MTHPPHADLQFRAPRPDESGAVAALQCAEDLAVLGHADSIEEDVADTWQQEGFTLADDARVLADHAGALHGYAFIERRTAGDAFDANAQVLPGPDADARRARLIEWLVARARAMCATPAELGVFVESVYPAKRSAFEHAGFTCTRHVHRLGITLGATAPEAPTVSGIALRAYAPGTDDEALHTSITEAFDGHWRFAPSPREPWIREQTSHARFDPELFRIAWDGTTFAGAVTCLDVGDLGWVKQLGVRPAWQGRGIGRALLLDVFARLHARGQRRVELGVDTGNTHGALALYERAGMTLVNRYEFWQRTVDPA